LSFQASSLPEGLHYFGASALVCAAQAHLPLVNH
jgi:hypothetical protein